MNVKQITELFERIKAQYNMFTYDSNKVKEWSRFLKDYDSEDVNKNFDKYILEYHDRPPLVFEVTRGLEKIEKEPEKYVYIQCEYCKERILVGDDDTPFEKHHRKCSKIDFMDRQSKEIRGFGVDKAHLRELSDEKLDAKYKKIMNNWVEEHPNEAVTPEKFGKGGNMGNLFKKIGDEEE